MSGILFWIFIALIGYVYFGYPLLLALLARMSRRPDFPPTAEPTLTLLIAAYNEESCIARKLDNALTLAYPRDKLQILVAADGSDDRTADIVRQYASQGVELSYQPVRQGKMAAITRALAVARGDVIVFSDANNIYETDTLRALVAPFASAQVGAVSGAKHILKDDGALSSSEGLYWKYESFIKRQETRLSSCTGVSGEIFAIRKALFAPAPRGTINDDFYLAMQVLRSGYRVVFAPAARSFERVSLTAEDEVIRRKRINAGRYQVLYRWRQFLPYKHPLLMWQIVSHKILRLFVPFFMLGAFIANLCALIGTPAGVSASLLRLTFPFNWILFGLQLAFYGLAGLGGRTARIGPLRKLAYLPAFLVNSNLAALQGWTYSLGGKDRSLWQKVRRAEEREG